MKSFKIVWWWSSVQLFFCRFNMPLDKYNLDLKCSCLSYIEVIVYVGLLFFAIPIQLPKPSEVEDEFQAYMDKFNKTYTDVDTYNRKLDAFRVSLEIINRLNANRTNFSAKFGLTKFTDLTSEEFMSIQTGISDSELRYSKTTTELEGGNILNRSAYLDNLPKIVDWRDKNVISKVKNQQSCQGCWAFATMETIESMRAIKTNELIDLSVQQMLDCSIYNKGCQGGHHCTLLKWLQDYNISIATEADYPLTLKNDECRQNTTVNFTTYIDTYQCNNFVGRENVILKLLAEVGPVTVGVSASTWQNYVGGVIQSHCNGNLNHAVQIVGYNLNAEVPHYIIRNSWGEDFGDNGYMYIAIGSNQCGVAYGVASLSKIIVTN